MDAGFPGMLPVPNRECVAQAVRTGLGLDAADQPVVPLRPQELLLRRPAAGLPDQPVRAPGRGRGRGRDRTRRRRPQARRHHPPASGAGRRQVAARPAPHQELHRPQPLGRGADGDRLRARHAEPRGGRRLPDQAAPDHALPRHLRRQHGRGLAPRRRQRLRPQAGGGVPHPLRGEERQLHPLRHAGGGGGGAPPDRGLGRGRHGGAGDAPVRHRPRRHPLHALQGRGARLPLLPRPRPAAAGAGRGLGRGASRRPARAAGRPPRPLRARLRPLGLRRARAGAGEGDRRLFRGGGARAATRSSPPTG